MSEVNSTVEKAEARAKLVDAYKGLHRYYKIDEGERISLPEYMFNEWYTPEGIFREVCTGLDDKNKPIWIRKDDAPAPKTAFMPETNRKSESQLNPAAAMPPFDYQPPAYASDTESGGPSNFDDNAGGDDNPRNPLLEGEVPDQYKEALDEFREKLLALEAENVKVKKLLAKQAKADKPDTKKTSGEDALKKLIDNGKPK